LAGFDPRAIERRRLDLTADDVRALFDYDDERGLLIWKSRPREHFTTDRQYAYWNTRYVGQPAGCVKAGRRHVAVFKRQYLAYRLVWLWTYGEWPDEYVDHIDGNSANDRIENLRSVSHAENCRNVKHKRRSLDLPMGVYRHREKYTARLNANGKNQYLGLFETVGEAHAARLAALSVYGFHPNHGAGV
jgi:hypothetical protein